MHDLGKLVRERRTARGIGLRELAAIVRLSPSTLSFLENGKDRIGEHALERVLTGLGVPVAERDVWYAAAGIIPAPIRAALLARPGAWTHVREALASKPVAL